MLMRRKPVRCRHIGRARLASPARLRGAPLRASTADRLQYDGTKCDACAIRALSATCRQVCAAAASNPIHVAYAPQWGRVARPAPNDRRRSVPNFHRQQRRDHGGVHRATDSAWTERPLLLCHCLLIDTRNMRLAGDVLRLRLPERQHAAVSGKLRQRSAWRVLSGACPSCCPNNQWKPSSTMVSLQTDSCDRSCREPRTSRRSSSSCGVHSDMMNLRPSPQLRRPKILSRRCLLLSFAPLLHVNSLALLMLAAG